MSAGGRPTTAAGVRDAVANPGYGTVNRRLPAAAGGARLSPAGPPASPGGTLGLGCQTGVMPFSPNQVTAYDRLGQWGGGSANPAYQGALNTVSNVARNPGGGYGANAMAGMNRLAQQGIGGSFNRAQQGLGSIASQGLGAFGDRAFRGLSNLASDGFGGYGDNALQSLNRISNQGLGARGDQAAAEYRSQMGNQIPRATQRALEQTANGQYLRADSNPYMRGMYEAASAPIVEQFNTQVAPGIAAQFSGSGRYGAPSQAFVGNQAAGRLADSLGNMSSNMYGNAYAQERQNQLGAANSLGSLTQQDLARQQQAASGLAGVASTEQNLRAGAAGAMGGLAGQEAQFRQGAYGQIGNLAGQEQGLRQNAYGQMGNLAAQNAQFQQGAYGNLGNMANQRDQMRLGAAGMMPGMAGSMDQAQLARINALQQSGAPYQQMGQQLINQTGQNYMGGQQAPWQNMGNLAGILNGGGNFSTQTQSGGGGGVGSMIGGGMGGAMGGAAIGSMIPGLGTGWGAALGGGMGILGGLF
jgi:hypothetical protein